MAVTSQPESREWEDGLLNCCTDCKSCCCGFMCYHLNLCKEYKNQDEGCCTAMFIPLAMMPLLTKYRTQHGIDGSIFKDCLMGGFCAPCALCRLQRDAEAHK